MRIPGVSLTLADAVGAGDAFSAAFVYILLKHNDPFLAGKVGNCVGAFVAGENGPIPQYSDSIRKLLIE